MVTFCGKNVFLCGLWYRPIGRTITLGNRLVYYPIPLPLKLCQLNTLLQNGCFAGCWQDVVIGSDESRFTRVVPLLPQVFQPSLEHEQSKGESTIKDDWGTRGCVERKTYCAKQTRVRFAIITYVGETKEKRIIYVIEDR